MFFCSLTGARKRREKVFQIKLSTFECLKSLDYCNQNRMYINKVMAFYSEKIRKNCFFFEFFQIKMVLISGLRVY